MPTRLIPYLKFVVHLLCLAPLLLLVQYFRSGRMALDPDPVQTFTHFTGNWALRMLMVSLAVTPARRLHPKFGGLIVFRRMLGLYAFFYATLHLATYVFLYSGYDLPAAWAGLTSGHVDVAIAQGKAVWPTIWDDVRKRAFIQLGFIAWMILLALAVTSPTAVLRALGGKNWQRLHRLVYAAAILACIHYWWLVKAGVRAPLPDTLVLAVLLLARVWWVARKRMRLRPAQ
jgi:sulfoxide reductase heme-binding subunit YedZ